MTIIHDKTKYGLGWFPTEVRRGLRWRGSPVIFFSGGPAPLWGGTHQLGDSAQYSRESRWDGALLSVGRRPQSRHGAKSSRGLKPPPLMGLMQCCSRRRSPKFSFFFLVQQLGLLDSQFSYNWTGISLLKQVCVFFCVLCPFSNLMQWKVNLEPILLTGKHE